MISMEDRDALMRMTKHLLIDAYENGNVQDYARLVREYEKACPYGWPVSHLSETFVSHRSNYQSNQ